MMKLPKVIRFREIARLNRSRGLHGTAIWKSAIATTEARRAESGKLQYDKPNSAKPIAANGATNFAA